MSLIKLLTHFFIFLTFWICQPLQAQLFKNTKAKRQASNFYKEDPTALDSIVDFSTNNFSTYKGSTPKYFELLHTQLIITPSFENRSIQGTALLKMHAHFYPQSEIILDAKGMEFDSITYSLDYFKTPLEYQYDGMKLSIQLPELALYKDTFNLKIQYTAYPHQLDSKQSELGQGAYFINHQQSNPYRSTVLWTQGQTEASSCWFPTFDAINQKTSQEIIVTVPDSMVSISNGTLINSRKNKDGTRTDYWKQDQRHSPYLSALVVGPFIKTEVHWKNLPISYYTLPNHKESSKHIFGRTPEMMEFFSNILNYEYPWDNYKQVSVYDFVAGAMENSSLSIYNETLMGSKQDLHDKVWDHDLIIAHELMHHWFGNLVTPKSWSHLTLSESFANYGENLWLEHWKGKADAHVLRYQKYQRYLHEYTYKKAESIVQNHYLKPNEIFNRHRYDKGGIVLHLLRNYIGDEAFFKALNLFLKTYEYKTAEVHQLRIAFEEITGQDLNWFFEQWFYHPGHPIVDIQHSFDENNKNIVIKVEQKQINNLKVDVPLHRMLVDVGFIYKDSLITHEIEILNRFETFTFKSDHQPLVINIDPGKNQVWEANYNYTNEELALIYENSDEVLDKIFVIDQFKSRLNYTISADVLLPNIEKQHWFVRERIIDLMSRFKENYRQKTIKTLQSLLQSNLATERNKALLTLQLMKHESILNIARSTLKKDSSYLVISTCLKIIAENNNVEAYNLAKLYTDIRNPAIENVLVDIFASHPKPEDLEYFKRSALSIVHYYSRDIFKHFERYLLAVDEEVFNNGLETIIDIIENEYPNQRVFYAKRLIKSLYSISIGESNMTEYKKKRLRELDIK